ncbi:Aste57867_21395 [Aphanomyces stellatus]|uniref:Aste57867_21395 protein n=1 Tax=Aphanomyces stellatus TaxID=120398 RepID=A0A485LJH2_9STRA|nr:hypothetical protein As57867_021326 [Aphanomyces stellatus]VFT98066.1 Aste57867_21395 [Aphanomyces stellatus]
MWSLLLGVSAAAYVAVAVAIIYMEEKKLFKDAVDGKVLLFGLLWILVSAVEFVLVAPLMFVLAPNELQVLAHQVCQVVARGLHVVFFGPVVVEGKEHMNPNEVYMIVANHQTMMDITALYHLDGNFSWVSKSSIFLLPGAGWIMKLANYVPLTRKSKDSVLKMFEAAKDRFHNGWSVCIFPQGTRQRGEFLPFKDGAFDLAVTANVRVLPVTVIIPDDLWAWTRPGKVKLIVHKPLEKGLTKAELKQQSHDVIAASMPKLK